MDSRLAGFSVTVLISVLMFLVAREDSSAASRPSGTNAFTKNVGQWPDSILFRSSANGPTMWFTKNGIWYQFFRPIPRTDDKLGLSIGANLPRLPHDEQLDSIETTMIKAEFVGSSESVEVLGLEEMEYKCNYFIGNEPIKWRTNVPNYSVITMRGLYSGVDITFSSNSGKLESEITAAIVTDLNQVKVEFRGATEIMRDADGSALVQTPMGERIFEGALLQIRSEFKSGSQFASVASSATGVNVEYSTYLGGSGFDNYLPPHGGIAIDADGCAYVTSYTAGGNFPILSPFQPSFGGHLDAFVTKISSAGDELIYSSFLGGSLSDIGKQIAVDDGGSVYLTGNTLSPNFPTRSPFQSTFGGGYYDVFVVKLNSTGDELIYSTYFGGSDIDYANGIAVDAGENAYVGGFTSSKNFPTQNPFQGSIAGDFSDAFVAKFSQTGSELTYSTYLGGSYDDFGYGMTIDTGGNAYVTGFTQSLNYPTKNSIQATYGGGYYDAFVTKLNVSGSELIYSTYLGGNGYDGSRDIAVDNDGNCYLTGETQSLNFPIKNPLQSHQGSSDGFVTKINSDGCELVYSTFFGGSDDADGGYGIAVDSGGNAYVTGWTQSENFPLQNPYQSTNGGYVDAFITKVNSAGSGLIYSTYLGGNDWDAGQAITVDSEGNAFVSGVSYSLDFPTFNPVQSSLGGRSDSFVAKFGGVLTCCIGSRGNVSEDVRDMVNLIDITALVRYLFQAAPVPHCYEEADVSMNYSINIVDLTTLVAYLFSGGAPLPTCP